MTDDKLSKAIAKVAQKALAGRSVIVAANETGIPEATLRRVLAGHGLPSVQTLVQVCEAAGVQLFEGLK